MDFEITVVRIGFARQQGFEFTARHFAFELAQRLFGVGDGLDVILALAELNHHALVAEFLLNAAKRAELILQRVTLAHHALRARLIVPKIGILGFAVQLGKAAVRGIDVKDASSAVRSTARCLQ
jgi:hypothetical protein